MPTAAAPSLETTVYMAAMASAFVSDILTSTSPFIIFTPKIRRQPMKTQIESASAFQMGAGKYAVRLPWRQYRGLALSADAVAFAHAMATHLAPEIEGTETDVDGLTEIADALQGFLDLLKSKTAASLVDAPSPPEGVALCIRPLQIAKTWDNKLCAEVHLDTIASFSSVAHGIVREIGATKAPHAAELLAVLHGWYNDLKPALTP
ncbi:hypothetical protein [Enhygromyxa salina]|uniref:hypothetical protein n=1 Tax=Enhygromyxa salina TaxID=215803 RepID=UPI0011BAA81F|nr:hypothetical protein [Enhygromyxa salina]